MFEKQIARGAKYLDKHFPGWVSRIDLDTFDTNDCNQCVVSQGTENDYYEWENKNGVEEALRCGFLADNEVDWDALTRLWREEVLRRREKVRTKTDA